MKLASSAGKNAASKPRLVFGFTSDWLTNGVRFSFNQSQSEVQQNQRKRK